MGVNAFQGLCKLIKANHKAALPCVPELAAAIGSFNPPPEELKTSFQEILQGYKQEFGAKWPELYARLGDDLKFRLRVLYSLGPLVARCKVYFSCSLNQ